MTNARLALTAITLLAALTACQAGTGPTSAATPKATTVSGPPAGSCHARTQDGQPLPDPACTPGALNPAVTQATIHTTICVRGWTATVRPPVSYTDRIKRESIQAYGLPSGTRGELDHLVPLEIGGSPADPRNLWIEVGPIPNPKDTVEGDLNRAVCSGRVMLAAAQQAIISDWVTAEHVVGLR
jgi:hypothetical protein